MQNVNLRTNTFLCTLDLNQLSYSNLSISFKLKLINLGVTNRNNSIKLVQLFSFFSVDESKELSMSCRCMDSFHKYRGMHGPDRNGDDQVYNV